MSIRNISPNKWQIDYYPEGRKGQRVRIVFLGTEPEARQYELELRRKSANSPSFINPKIIDILPEYIEWIRIHRSPATVKGILQKLKWLLPIFGNLPISRITPSIITQFKLSRSGRNRSINLELDYLRGIIKWMVTNNYADPLGFKIEKVPHKARLPRVPNPLEIEQFLDEIKDPRKKAMALFMYELGLRFREVKNLRWENISWEDRTIQIVDTKGGRPRMAILSDSIMKLLEVDRKAEGFLFLNPKTGQPYNAVRTLFRNASARAGIARIKPHSLRHAFGTYTLEATSDLRAVQELMGHKDIKTTQIYTQIMTERKKEIMKKTHDYIGQLRETLKKRKTKD